MKTYEHVVKAFYSTTWAILPEKYEAIKALIDLKARGGNVSEADLVQFRSLSRPSPRTAGLIAVIPLLGTISYRGSMLTQYSGGTSVQQTTKAFRQALADDSIKAIVFDIDSPGGEIDGVQEFADEIFNARSQKKIVAVANTMAASAAYWIGCSAGEFVITPSGMTGSIGVFTSHEDYSKMDDNLGVKVTYISAGKYKTEANPDAPLSDDARTAIQSIVDDVYANFVSSVARGRGVKTADVRNGMGQGRVVTARDAVRMNMADRVATLDQTIARFGGPGHAQGAMAGHDRPRLALAQRRLEMQRITDNEQAVTDEELADLDRRRLRLRKQGA